MIQFTKHCLSNGLKVILYPTLNSQMVAINVLYDVGAKDEDPLHTGFAHLFEHLMFGGSVNVPDYDQELQKAGGENNAYTTNDFTNYYIQLPHQNIETALWLESDRMLGLNFNLNSLEVQKKVVCEEFKEHYINKPYGDVWKIIREMCYKTHPYQWQTIGKELSHIENSTIDDVKNFFKKHYNPSNAILAIGGNINEKKTLQLVQKWFGNIPAGNKYVRQLPPEPPQNTPRFLEKKANVPSNAFYKCWHIPHRRHQDYHAIDVLSDILGQGNACRLNQSLVKEKKLFSHLGCYHLGSIDNSLFVIEGKLNNNIDFKAVENAIDTEIDKIQNQGISDKEFQKSINQIETSIEFENQNLLNITNELAYFELLENAQNINTELQKYQNLIPKNIQQAAQQVFVPNHSNTLYYISN